MARPSEAWEAARFCIDEVRMESVVDWRERTVDRGGKGEEWWWVWGMKEERVREVEERRERLIVMLVKRV